MDVIEAWWVDRIKDFFASKPFHLNIDAGSSVSSAVWDLLDQAKKRQKDNPGTMYQGAVLQHLVGAKMQLLMGDFCCRCADRPERGFYGWQYNHTCDDCSRRIIDG